LEAGESKDFTFELQSSVTGNFTIVTSVSYKIDKFSRRVEDSSSILIECDCPYIDRDFNNDFFYPGQSSTLTATLVSPSTAKEFKNVNLYYFTDVPGLQDYATVHSSIKPGETLKIFSYPIIAPPLGEEYFFNISVKFESSANQVFILKDNILIKLRDSVVIEEKIEDAVESDSEEDVSVKSVEPDGSIDDTESDKQEDEVEIPTTTIKDEEKKPIRAYSVVIFVAVLIFFLVIAFVLKTKKESGTTFSFRRKKDSVLKGRTLDEIEKAVEELEKKENK